MDQQQPLADNRRFGKYLRKIREERRLSLDTVEELSLGLPERVTKSHLSRIENGRAIPSFPRMFTLSQIYGVPVSSMAERFELCLKAEMYPAKAKHNPIDDILDEARDLRRAGRYTEALLFYESLLERATEVPEVDRAEHVVNLRLECINCLLKLNREFTAKEECEKLLSSPHLTPEQQLIALHSLASCCLRLGKHTVAMMVVNKAEQTISELQSPGEMAAFLKQQKGDLLAYTEKFDEAIEAYSAARAAFEAHSNAFESCRTVLNMAACLVETRRYGHARRMLREVIKVSETAGYDRQRALALSHMALLYYRQNDIEEAEAHCLRSNRLARPREYIAVLFRNCFYLWRIAQARGDETGSRTHERTLRTYLTRVEDSVPEAEEFKAFLGGGRDE